MEERQTQIREGAGLEESRLNVEFIELLKKWSSPLLLVVAAVVGLYLAYTYYQKMQQTALDAAFAQFDAAYMSRNPVSLERIAEDEAGKGAVSLMARLSAADLRLEAYRTGLPAGIALDQDGKLPEGMDFLTEEQRQGELVKAEALYQAVIDQVGLRDASATSSSSRNVVHGLGAMSGLAAIAECRGKFDDAKARYEQQAAIAKAAGLEKIAAAAKKRIETLDQLKEVPRLYKKDEVAATAPKPAASSPLKIGPDGKVQGGGTSPLKIEAVPKGPEGPTPASPTPPAPPAGEQPPAPAPAPAPAPTPPAGEPGKPN